MQLHQISPKLKLKKKKRIGRGGKRGTYSGHGQKVQKSRAGAKIRPAWRDFIKKLPKLRGVKFKGLKVKPWVINLGSLEKSFQENETVSVKTLLDKNLVAKIKGRKPIVKILGEGELTKKLNFQDLAMSESAKEKIEKAGGKIS